MSQAAKYGGLICMHAENGGVIDVIVRRALAEGKRAPKYHALTRPTTAEGEATGRAIALAEMAGAPVYIVHLSCNDALEKVREARDRGLPAYAETCPQYLYLSLEQDGRARIREREVRFYAAAPRKMASGKALAGAGARYAAGGLHRPLSFLLQGTEGAGQGRFHQDSQWRPRHRAPPEPGLHGRRTRRAIFAEPFRAARLDLARQAFRACFRARARSPSARMPIWCFLTPNEEQVISAKTHHMRVDYSMFEGIRIKGMPKIVLSQGRTIIENGKFVGKAGSGEFIRRQRYAGF